MKRDEAYALLIPITRAMNDKTFIPSGFEDDFIASIKYKLRGQGYRLSEKQAKILQDIHKKVTNGR